MFFLNTLRGFLQSWQMNAENSIIEKERIKHNLNDYNYWLSDYNTTPEEKPDAWNVLLGHAKAETDEAKAQVVEYVHGLYTYLVEEKNFGTNVSVKELTGIKEAVDEYRTKVLADAEEAYETATLEAAEATGAREQQQALVNEAAPERDAKGDAYDKAYYAREAAEKDFEENTLAKIIRRNIEANTTNNQIKVITALLEQVIVPNMIVDEEATALARKNARDMISPIRVKFNKGDTIVKVGEPITQVKKEALSKAGYNILRINFKGILGILCIVCIGVSSVYFYLKFFEPKFINRRYLSIIAVLSLFMALLSIFLPVTWSVFMLPFPFFAILLSVFLNARTSFFTTVTLLTIITLSLQFSALAMSVFILSIMVSTIGTTTIKYSRRFDLIKVGVCTALAMAVIITCVYYDLGIEKLSQDVSAGILNGFVSGIFALGMIPIFENWFKVITPFGLAELGDYNQPLLKKLHEVAPGTFEHSLRVSNLAESAAEAIGADPILARVGALYHDVGKIVRPLFFVENQTYSGIENPHEKINPRSSKMIITSHTKDGITLAKEYHIPDVIQDFIIQHHGDSLASYFYNQAVQQEGIENVKEEQFRYTGPKPNTKETAILMIADAVESASRTLKDHSQEELDTLINKIIKDRLNDNQLSDSPLTLKDIKVIAATLSRVLRSVFHKRIKYQEPIDDIPEKEKNN